MKMCGFIFPVMSTILWITIATLIAVASGSSINNCDHWLSKRRTWIDDSSSSTSDFSIHNIPFGVFIPQSGHDSANHKPRVGTIIGDYVIDMKTLYKEGLFNDITGLPENDNIFHSSSLNRFMSLSRSVWRQVRHRLIELLLAEDDSVEVEDEQSLLAQGDESNTGTCASTSTLLSTGAIKRLKADYRLRDNADLRNRVIHHKNTITVTMPVEIKEYTDFYSSKEHATNVGIMFRGKENALQPNWLYLPVGYHGRASTVVVSGTPVRRPYGQLQKDPSNPKEGSIFAPCKNLDIELEMGVLLGGEANALGVPITLEEAEERIFGVVLLNDWSARDIQSWEYVPLGPFTSKNFCSSISPWVVTLDALEIFRTSPSVGEKQENPTPLEYLYDVNYGRSSFDVNLTVQLQPAGEGEEAMSLITRSNYRNQYWNMKQQLVHHSITGAIMRPGDLLGSGTISGQDEGSYGSMLELSWKGTKTIELENSKTEPKQTRKFLQDGDRVVMTGFAERNGIRVGFGSVEGTITPAVSPLPTKK